MSAFVVEDETINKIVNTALALAGREGVYVYWNGTPRYFTRADAQEMAQILLNENYRSVNWRYKESSTAHEIEFHLVLNVGERVSAIASAFKAADCLDYQSCETDDWESTLACAIINACRSALWHALPGYEQAKWG